MDIIQLSTQILFGKRIEDKLLAFNISHIQFPPYDNHLFTLPMIPGRQENLQFSDKRIKFPKKTNLDLEHNRALVFHFFANHELIAIEMFAAAILLFPHNTPEEILFKKGLLSALSDEQKHFSLYQARMRQLGIEFGDYPLNGHFWKHMPQLDHPAKFLAAMSLTFESANLDFAAIYAKHFQQIEDTESASIMNAVLKDEISHVALGAHWLQRWAPKIDLWKTFLEYLPHPLTPARSKGPSFNFDARKSAGLSDSFIQSVSDYKDAYPITHRKEWKNDHPSS